MTSIPVKLMVAAVGLAFGLAAASPAETAKARKHRTHASAPAANLIFLRRSGELRAL